MDTKRHTGKRQKTIVALSVLLVLTASAGTLFFIKYRQAKNDNPVNRQEQLTRQLGEVMEIPDETPVISTVLDKSKLANDTLEARARNGDVLFIFSKSKRLVLYRSTDKKVVDILNIR